jgi:membrane-associated protease RseP (regulator of RpoE activity)
MMGNLYRLAALVALVVAPAALGAQRAPAPAPIPRGWIGVSFEVITTGDRGGMSSQVIVSGVEPGSPADAAGLRLGDTLLAIGQVRGADAFTHITDRLRLAPGDSVSVIFLRNGLRQRVTVEAAARPALPSLGTTVTLTLQPDSMVETMFRTMDSLRVRLIQARDGDVRLIAVDGVSDSLRILGPWEATEVRAPLEFFVFRGERHDSLRDEMSALNQSIRDLRRQEQRRLRAIAEAQGRLTRAAQDEDPELRRVRELSRQFIARSNRLRAAMEEDARTAAGEGYAFGWNPGASGAKPVTATVDEFRPLAPYILGQNRVAGAHIVDLEPELAAYFEVDGGVLVVDVPAGTPAATAGIKPGDVIIRVDSDPVRSVQELRVGLGRAERSTPITLIRQGTSLQLLLRR